MFYTYVLISIKTKRYYTGHTGDLKQRLKEHNSKAGGEYSRSNAPFKLIFYETFLSKTDAIKQEKFYKSGYGREVLHNKIENSLKMINKS